MMTTVKTIIKTPKLITDLGMMFANESSENKRRYGLYECPYCNVHFKAITPNIKRGLSQSCGCEAKRKTSIRSMSHGESGTRLYKIFMGMKKRTQNKNYIGYQDYGNRGIKICKEWNEDFIKFRDWSMANGYKDNLSIDRIDNDKGYSPDNCRWTNNFVQARNTRILNKRNTSGYRGVSYRKDMDKYRCLIRVNRKNINIGHFKTALEGAKAYDRYIIENNLEHTINGVLQA